MRFTHFRTQGFRNFSYLEAAFPAGPQFILGANGQGKTNLLEGLGLVTSLRSFRTTDLSALFKQGIRPPAATLCYEIDHQQLGPTSLEIQLHPRKKVVLLDGNPVRKLNEILGLFPTITFSSQDIQILRGNPTLRRRVMDLMFVVMEARYYTLLTRYHKALKARNLLLRRGAATAHRRPFEDQLIESGWELTALRADLLQRFEPHFAAAYNGVSGVHEEPELSYEASLPATSPSDYERGFLASSQRDLETGTSNRGPHRDDLGIALLGQAAKDYASEGQQRGLVLSLRLGLVDWYRAKGGTPPVILADDIVGELDAGRRQGFWRMLGSESQIIATGTALPKEDRVHDWACWGMEAGQLTRHPEGLES